MDPTIGDNRPPIDRDYLNALYADLIKRRDALLEAAGRVPNELTADDARKLTDFIKQITACVNAFEEDRKKAKQPHLDAGRHVDGFFKDLSGPLADKVRPLKASLLDYMFSHQERLRGEYGALATTTQRWTFKGLERNKVDKTRLWKYLDDECIEKALKKYIDDGGRAIKGAIIYQEIGITIK